MRKKAAAAKQEARHKIVVPVVTPTPNYGLTQEEVALRRGNGYANCSVTPPSKSVRQIIFSNIFTYYNMVFFGLAICLGAVGAFKDMLFMVVVVANTLIGIIQEIRAKQTLDKLTLLSVPQTKVVREGQESSVDINHLVRDDVAIFTAGNQIPADASILEGQVQVNEALITGESEPVTKAMGDELLSGSFILSGKCYAALTRVGADSYVSKLTLEAKRTGRKKQSEMMNSLNKLIRYIGIAIIPLGILLFCKQHFILELSAEKAMIATVAALVGMIPEGLYLLTSMALAVSVMRLAKQKTLVHELSCIETLARVDVLCVDKTGTITENAMQVSELVPLGEPPLPATHLEQILSAFYHSMEADNETAQAMQKRFALSTGWKADRCVPFTSATKWSAVSFAGQGVYLVGAPDFILKGALYEPIRHRVEAFSAQGNRVLLLAQCNSISPEKQIIGDPQPLALILLANKIRDTAPQTFQYFAQQGVAIKVISGDNALTVSQVAQRAGIADAQKYIDASALKTQEEIEKAVEEYTVFGRVTPDQKRQFVGALKRAGHTVAMTGDGVNDVLALKDADCSIAMASGSEAACHVSQLVLLDSDFAAMPHVVAEGRRVINNIERAASLFLVKNIFSFLLSFISLFVAIQYPFTPLQLSMLSGLTIGFPSFCLALEPNKSLVRGHFMSNIFRKALPGGLTDLIVVLGVLFYASAFGLSQSVTSTMCALMLYFVGLVVLFQVCKPIDWKRGLVWGFMTLCMLFGVTVLGSFFSLVPLATQPLLLLILFMLLTFPVMRMLLNWEDKTFALSQKIRVKARSAFQKKRKNKSES